MTNPLLDDEHAPVHLAAQDRPLGIETQELFAAVRNFHEVTPYLFRGGQPGHEGIEALARAGVKTVLSLRNGAGNVEPAYSGETE